jgi:hypothetical protein
MSRLGPPFYGLTLTPEDKLRVHQEIFKLAYYGQGFDHDTVYSMPVYLRYFNLKMLMEEKKAEQEAAKNQEQSMAPKPKGVARPNIKKPT